MKIYKTGDMRNGLPVLAPVDRKNIIILSDDIRMSSGIAVMTREFVMGLVHRYNFIQLGSAINHPEKGKELDLGSDMSDRSGVSDVGLRVVPWSGYGDPNILRQLLSRYQPAGILHFTDPKYFKWLYEIEAEIRAICPIMYYNIWDSVGSPDDSNFGTDPQYNQGYYASCDGLFAISKQTYGMNHRVLGKGFSDEVIIK